MNRPSQSHNPGKSSLAEFIKSYPDTLSPATANAYRKAVRSFLAFVGDEIADIDTLEQTMIGDWMVDMLIGGHSFKTASYYLDNLCSICNAAARNQIIHKTDTFKQIKEHLRNFTPAQADLCRQTVAALEAGFPNLLTMIRTAGHQQGELAVYTDITTLLLLNPTLQLKDIIKLKKTDLPELTDEARAIAGRHSSSRRQFIFPLHQNEKTIQQIERRCNEKIAALLKYRNIPTHGNAAESLQVLWIFTALRIGIKASTAIAALGTLPEALKIFSVAVPSDSMSAHEKIKIFAEVAKTLIENPVCWHVMRLRRGVSFNTLQQRISADTDRLHIAEIFYPAETIARKLGRKVIYKDKPIIPGIIFFQSRHTDIGRIMRHTGDIAWCVRDRSRSDRPYAIVSRAAMTAFQQAIGQFTPDTQLYPLGTLSLQPADRVIVIGGDWSGTQAVIEKAPDILSSASAPAPSSSTSSSSSEATGGAIIYQIRFIDDTGFEWHIPADSRLLKKL